MEYDGMVITIEVVMDNKIHRFDYESQALRFINFLPSWTDNDEVRFVVDGVCKMRWRIDDFVK